MRLVNAEAFDEYLEQAELEAVTHQRCVLASAIHAIREDLAKFPTVISQWTPISEGLPEYGQDVLVCDIDGDVWLTHLARPDGGMFNASGDKIKNVAAWMMVPECYRGDEE